MSENNLDNLSAINKMIAHWGKLKRPRTIWCLTELFMFIKYNWHKTPRIFSHRLFINSDTT